MFRPTQCPHGGRRQDGSSRAPDLAPMAPSAGIECASCDSWTTATPLTGTGDKVYTSTQGVATTTVLDCDHSQSSLQPLTTPDPSHVLVHTLLARFCPHARVHPSSSALLDASLLSGPRREPSGRNELNRFYCNFPFLGDCRELGLGHFPMGHMRRCRDPITHKAVFGIAYR